MHQYTLSNAADRSLTASTVTTLLGIGTPSTRRVKIKEVWAAFASVTASDAPVQVDLCTYTSAGTSSAGTPQPCDQQDPAALCTGFDLCTVEPTGTVALMTFKVSPIGTTLIYQAPLGDEIELKVSQFFGIRCNSPQSESGIRFTIKFQE